MCDFELTDLRDQQNTSSDVERVEQAFAKKPRLASYTSSNSKRSLVGECSAVHIVLYIYFIQAINHGAKNR